MLEHVVTFYKNLFGQEDSGGVSLDHDFWELDEKVTDFENEMLEAPFSENEVREAVFSSYAEGAPGPDGFSFLFYHVFWDVIKDDLMGLTRMFELGDLNLDILNYDMITLIPKEPEVKVLKKFRPISLINCSFKIFYKLLNNRLIKVADRLLLLTIQPSLKVDLFWKVWWRPMKLFMRSINRIKRVWC
jgi:hypothetical protein